MRAVVIAALLASACCTARAQLTPAEALVRVLPPAASTEEAFARCPDASDVALRGLLDTLTILAEGDSLVQSNLLARQRSLSLKLVGTLHRQFEAGILAAGEEIDRRIRNCPKMRDSTGQSVYSMECVEEAERSGRLQRVAVTEEFLSSVHQRWPEYVEGTRTLLTAAKTGGWRLVLQLARESSAITQTAAQFAR